MHGILGFTGKPLLHRLCLNVCGSSLSSVAYFHGKLNFRTCSWNSMFNSLGLCVCVSYLLLCANTIVRRRSGNLMILVDIIYWKNMYDL